MKCGRFVWLLAFMASLGARASEWFVSTNGTGNGSFANPWSLQTALTNSAVQPGDTVWLRGGIYFPVLFLKPHSDMTNTIPTWQITSCTDGVNVFGCNGTSNNPVTLRSYSNEWAVIDRPWYWSWMPKKGGYVTFRDLEFYNSLQGNMPGPVSVQPWHHFYFTPGQEFGLQCINCIIHDVNIPFQGTLWSSVRGCIIWDVGVNGWEHVCYPGVSNFSGNICAWIVNDVIEHNADGSIVQSNIIFGDGATSGGGGIVARMDTGSYQFIRNCIYDFNLFQPTNGWAVGTYLQGTDCSFSNNFVVSPNPVPMPGSISKTITFVGNTIYSSVPGPGYYLSMSAYTPNIGVWMVDYNKYYNNPAANGNNYFLYKGITTHKSFAQWRSDNPTFDVHSTCTDNAYPPDTVFVIPNQDQPKRCHIAVYNFTRKDNVSVSLTGVLNSGDSYRLISAQNPQGGITNAYSIGDTNIWYSSGLSPILSGRYDGHSITVPMTNLTTAPVLYATNWGLSNAPPTSPEFGAFIVIGSPPQKVAPATNLRVLGQ